MSRTAVATNITLEAGADLSSSQYLFVDVNSSGKAVVAGNGGNAVGVLQNNPASGAASTVQTAGIAKVIASGSITAGARVASDAAGKAKTAASTNHVLGRALEEGAANRVISVLLMKDGIAA